MLHNKFRGNRPASSREEDFEGFYHIKCGSHLNHVTSIMSTNFHFLVPGNFHTKFGSERHSSFRENLA